MALFKHGKTRVYLFFALLIFAAFSSIVILLTAAKFNNDRSLTLLAAQFLKGHISMEPDKSLPLGDIALYGGKYYLYFGPLPSMILVPAVALFGRDFPQVFIGITSLVVTFYVVYLLARFFKFGEADSLWLSLFIAFSTVLLSSSLINITAYQVEVLGVPLVFLSLYFYFAKKNYALAGLFLGLAILTRFTLIFGLAFFVAEFLQKRMNKRDVVHFLAAFFFCFAIFAGYNFIRFHSFLETGYNHLRPQPFPLSKNYEFGAVSPAHIPANLYSFLIMPPEPILHYSKGFVLKFPYLRANPWGMAIWFTSPLFLFLLFKFKKWKYTISALIAAVFLAIPIFTYFSVGFAQFGYRYALDFLPFLFLLLIPSLSPKLSKAAIALIAAGVIFNGLYITSLWGVYPFFGIN